MPDVDSSTDQGKSPILPAIVPAGSNLPAIPPAPPPPPRRWRRLGLLALLLAIIGGGGIIWWTHRPITAWPGIVSSNGRLEADEIDISTKYPGRVAAVLAEEGDTVKAGQVVARMDTSDLEAQLRQAQASIQQAEHTAEATRADIAQQKTQVLLAAQELQRTRTLVPNGFATRELLDQRQAVLDAAFAAYHSLESKLAANEAALQAAQHSAEVISVNIADATLVAPKDGRIEYRLANVGEVLGAGGKVYTMLDSSYVYMDVFLPTAEAGRAALGDEARLVLDAMPDRPVPARVAFIAAQNQFTPKTVETKAERDKLVFRVRVRIDPELLRAQPEQVRSGLPGMAYIRVDAGAAWPPFLQARPPA